MRPSWPAFILTLCSPGTLTTSATMGKRAELGLDIVERQPDAAAACGPCGFDVADVAFNFGAGGQVDAAAGFERFQSFHFEPSPLGRAFGAEVVFERNEKLCAGGDAISLERQSVAFAVGGFKVLVFDSLSLGFSGRRVCRCGLPRGLVFL